VAVGAIFAAVLGLWGSRHRVVTAIAGLDWWRVAAAVPAVLVGQYMIMRTWRRVLHSFGSDLPLRAAVRVFYLAEIAKYLPGSVWSLVGQMELCRDHGIPRRAGGTVGIVQLALEVAAALLVATSTLPFVVGAQFGRYGWGLVIVPLVLVALSPPVLNRLLDRVLRSLGQPPMPRRMTILDIGAALGWVLLTWPGYGLAAWLIGSGLGLHGLRGFLLSVGAWALAYGAGIAVFVTPGGLGTREFVLVVLLGPQIGTSNAIALALLMRPVTLVGELLWAATASILARWFGARELPATTHDGRPLTEAGVHP
jgi:uncharacterized membrane protein YbhN (UPF0104 family)